MHELDVLCLPHVELRQLDVFLFGRVILLSWFIFMIFWICSWIFVKSLLFILWMVSLNFVVSN
jgi:hypothetical protein